MKTTILILGAVAALLSGTEKKGRRFVAGRFVASRKRPLVRLLSTF